MDRHEASCHFEAERPDVAINDLEGRSQPGRVLIVAFDAVGSFQLLLSQFGQRVQAAAEQCSHLLGGLRERIQLELADRLEFRSGAVALQYRPTRATA